MNGWGQGCLSQWCVSVSLGAKYCSLQPCRLFWWQWCAKNSLVIYNIYIRAAVYCYTLAFIRAVCHIYQIAGYLSNLCHNRRASGVIKYSSCISVSYLQGCNYNDYVIKSAMFGFNFRFTVLNLSLPKWFYFDCVQVYNLITA